MVTESVKPQPKTNTKSKWKQRLIYLVVILLSAVLAFIAAKNTNQADRVVDVDTKTDHLVTKYTELENE